MTPTEKRKGNFLKWTKSWQLWSALEELTLTLQAVRSHSCDILSQQWHSLRARPVWPHRSWSVLRHSPTLAVWALCSIRVEPSVRELAEGQSCLTEKWMSVQHRTAEGWERRESTRVFTMQADSGKLWELYKSKLTQHHGYSMELMSSGCA